MQNILSRLNEIATVVTFAAEAETLEQVLERIAHASRELVQARYAALGIPDRSGHLKYFKVSGLSPEEIDQIERLPTGKGLLGAILESRKTIRLARIADDPRSVGFCAGHPQMTSFLGVPIQVGQQLFGSLYLCDRADGQPFTEEDQWLVESLAGYAALAIAGSQLREQRSRLALLEERERIGMELHDGVIQSLYAIGMQLDLIRTSDNHLKPGDLARVINDLNKVIDDIRRYIKDLKTSGYHQRTISECFRDMVARFHIPASLQVQVEAPDILPPFSPVTFEAICQIANEAISNAVRHSNARHIQVIARQQADLFQIVIADDGQGFNLENVDKQSGLGLRNIQQRARIHGGQVSIQTTPRSGTQVMITIPTLSI